VSANDQRRSLQGARPIGDVIRALMKRKRFSQKGRYAALTEAWRGIVGEGIAARTRISSFAGGELIVDVDSPVLLQELTSFLKDQLLAELQSTEPGRDMAQLRFRLGAVDDGTPGEA